MASNEVWLVHDGDSNELLGVYTSEKLANLAKTRFEPYWDHQGQQSCRCVSIDGPRRLDWDYFDMSEPPSASVRMGER